MKPKIYIDPGHGGGEPGASAHGINEKDLNLLVARELANLLSRSNYEVALSRYADVTVPLKTRTNLAASWGADLYISIHHNGFSNPAANGYEVFYQLYRGEEINKHSFRLAYLVNAEFGNMFFPELHSRGVKHLESPNKPKQEFYHVLRESPCPAIITECGFITSPADIRTLKNPSFPRKQAESIEKAIDAYFQPLKSAEPKVLTLVNFVYELNNLIKKYEEVLKNETLKF